MGWIDWSWWMKEEEKPAEPLVLGAELECEYGSQRSFLMVETDGISINDLPKACVEDSIAHRNIHPFGKCLKNDECYFKMDLEERWVNAEPQTERVNGKEIITTSSTLICKAAGMAIRAVTSGQDGRFARFQQFLKNMERKYPGLRETLEDPYGSVYLEGNYEMALQFLEEQIKGRGEGLEIVTLYDPKNLEGAYILAALERLMTDCEVRSFEGFMNDLRDTANQQGMQGKEGWDQNYLNEAMMELLRKDCKETAERIETNPVYRGMEKHKMFGSWLRECTEAFAYTTVMYSSALAEGNSSGRRMEGDKGRGAVKKGEEKGKESGSVTKPNQVHHYATNKSKTYTPQLEEIANRYELDLNDAWNKDLLPHQGRHPNAYHEYVLDSMKQFDNIAQGDKDIFLKLFDNLKNNVKSKPDMLYKDYWK